MCKEDPKLTKKKMVEYCKNHEDCTVPSSLCVFSTSHNEKICYRYGETVTSGSLILLQKKLIVTTTPTSLITAGPIIKKSSVDDNEVKVEKLETKSEQPLMKYVKFEKSEDDYPEISVTGAAATTSATLIDPAATVCDFDYHCRMGESCSGLIQFVDRNVTVCQYDVTNKNRQCLVHADCISGQQCIQHIGHALCRPSLAATTGDVECVYDYECSGGEKCVEAGEKKFRCRPSKYQDSKRNQVCSSNADCPFQQVCRRTAGVPMCVDLTLNPELLQEKMLQLVRNFLFFS